MKYNIKLIYNLENFKMKAKKIGVDTPLSIWSSVDGVELFLVTCRTSSRLATWEVWPTKLSVVSKPTSHKLDMPIKI